MTEQEFIARVGFYRKLQTEGQLWEVRDLALAMGRILDCCAIMKAGNND